MATKKRTEIECIECKNMIRFPEYIGVDFRTGELKCDKCGSKLRIRLNKWKVIDYYPVKKKGGEKSKEPEKSETLEIVQELARQAREEDKESKKDDV